MIGMIPLELQISNLAMQLLILEMEVLKGLLM